MTSEHFHEVLEVVNSRKIPPTPDILEALKQNYKIEQSIADLIDNSIDARATKVLVRFIRSKGRLVSLCIADNGTGMDDESIDHAMQFARRRDYTKQDLGMFGVGLKTASLSQATSLTVLSCTRNGSAVGRRWSEAGIRRHDWSCDVISQASAERELSLDWGPVGRITHGTVVRWDDVTDFKTVRANDVDAYVDRASENIRTHVGIRLHRFLNANTEITIDTLDADTGEAGVPMTIDPIEPFPAQSAAPGYPKHFTAEVPSHGKLKLIAHIWPKRSSHPGYKLGGKAAEHQGFYFYRHGRLIQAGGWNGWRAEAEPHFSLARVEVDIPDSFTSYLKVRSSKAGIDAPASFADVLDTACAADKTTLRQFVDKAEQVYRAKVEQTEKPMMLPGKGIPRRVRVALEKAGVPLNTDDAPEGMTITWGRVKGTDFFEIDRDNDKLTLNDRYRSTLNRGERGGAADVPVIRTLLYFLFESTLGRERGGVAEDARLDALQSALVAAMRLEKGGTDE
ncbi:MAG: ATP-binding protein [Myxococcaceae bacterium]